MIVSVIGKTINEMWVEYLSSHHIHVTSFVSCNATHLEQRKPLATLKYSVMLVLHFHFRYSTLFIVKENIQGYFSSRHL